MHRYAPPCTCHCIPHTTIANQIKQYHLFNHSLSSLFARLRTLFPNRIPMLLKQFLFLVLSTSLVATNVYLNSSRSPIPDSFYDSLPFLNTSSLANCSNSSRIGLQDKSTVGTVFQSLGKLVCGLFVVCDIIESVSELIVDAVQGAKQENDVVKDEIKKLTKYVDIRRGS